MAARSVRLRPNRRKILEAILWLIEEGVRLGAPLTQYQIGKSLFIADTRHLNTYGRPVTFDNYSALKFGPVPQEAYDMLKPSYDWARHMGLPGAPWEREPVTSTAYRYVRPTRAPDVRALSASDVKALGEAVRYVRELGFGGVRDETHQHPAYVEAWNNRGIANAKAMDYAMLFEEPDPEGAAEVAYASTHI